MIVPSEGPVELTLPQSVSAVVLLRHEPNGAVSAEYLEPQSRVPILKGQAAQTLVALAIDLHEQARSQPDGEAVNRG